MLALGLLPAATPENLHSLGDQLTRHSSENKKELPFLPSFAVNPEPGGVAFKGDLASLYRANLHLRTASRILVRLGTFFYATTFPEMEERTARLPWERFLRPGQPITMRVTCHDSKLYHSDAVMRSVAAGLAQRLGRASQLLKPDEQVDGHPAQLIIVRLSNDRCTISVDASGEPLYKRGYRQALAKAPLRETLAAALLMASGWERSAPLIDPFCGSGTIPIEAALLARNFSPGINRRFAFVDWPNYDEQLWNSARAETTFNNGYTQPTILAADRDAGAIQMAWENARRAGVEDYIEFRCQAVSYTLAPPGPGWVVSNPPYGVRISEGRDLRNLYAQFGNVLRRECPGWQLAILCDDRQLLGQTRIPLDTSLGFVNGGIMVRVGRGRVP